MYRRIEVSRGLSRPRDDGAGPALASLFPMLRSLRIELYERPGVPALRLSRTTIVRYLAVATASGRLVISCPGPNCRNGGHDASRELLRMLRRQETRFGNHIHCRGRVGNLRCTRVLHYVGIASYWGARDEVGAEQRARDVSLVQLRLRSTGT
jgi:hypothetical protein